MSLTPTTILQTGRLGDVWFTTPLAWHLHQQGHEVEVAYHAKFGNPFAFFPYVKPLPLPLRSWFPESRIGYGMNELMWQVSALYRLKARGRRVVWNQIFPVRTAAAWMKRRPYIEYWYRRYPQINFRTAPCALSPTPGNTILVFRQSQSIRFTRDAEYYAWIRRNLDVVIEATGFRPLVVAYGDQPDDPDYETWRGSLDAYQRLIAGCGLVFGISTSAHVLAQLIGKPAVFLYERSSLSALNRVGAEWLCVDRGETLAAAEVSRKLATIKP